jgi:hypothetical protein
MSYIYVIVFVCLKKYVREVVVLCMWKKICVRVMCCMFGAAFSCYFPPSSIRYCSSAVIFHHPASMFPPLCWNPVCLLLFVWVVDVTCAWRKGTHVACVRYNGTHVMCVRHKRCTWRWKVENKRKTGRALRKWEASRSPIPVTPSSINRASSILFLLPSTAHKFALSKCSL